MTTGQRIAAKRKEQKLSQEGLGEALGVSRQSIYKWESDASLPEIDKLIALSRLFGVSVGWLLGVEKEPSGQPEDGPQSDTLTEGQQKLVEEILSRYQQAQPAPQKTPWAKGLVWLLAAVCAVMLYNIFDLSDRVERMDNRYQNLQSAISSVTNSVNSQISSITGRVEEALKAQADLTADYGVEILSADLRENTVTFSAHVVPKTHTPGMEVRFVADHGEGPAVEVLAAEEGNKFSARITCPLTDEIDISVALVTPEARQTQSLEGFYRLYSGSLPLVELESFYGLSFYEREADGLFHLSEGWVADVTNTNSYTPAEDSAVGRAELVSLKVGLFRDRKLIQWLEPGKRPEDYYRGYGPEKVVFYHQPELILDLKDGEGLCFAALLTDEYGRSRIIPCFPSYRVMEGVIEHDSDLEMKFAETDPSYWDFDP